MRRGTVPRVAIALAATTLVHLGVWFVLTVWYFGVAPPVAGDEPGAPAEEPLIAQGAGQITFVELAAGDVAGVPQIPLDTLLGPADEVGRAQTHPAPNQPVDLPGEQAASRGGGARAGETAYTEHRDPTTDVPIRHEQWNGKRDYQSAHDRTGAKQQSPEAIRRDDRRDVSDRAATHRIASGGARDASSGRSSTGRGAGTAITNDREPAAPAGTTTPAATDGAVRRDPTPPQVEPGATATDTPVRADKPSDNTNAPASSNETRPGPFEVTPPGANGPARSGVAGDKPAPGQLGTANGPSTGATRWGAERGARDLAIAAAPQDPYFRTLFAKLEKAVVFPRQLALELRAGRPIAELVLRADGTIGPTRIAITSGTAGFDRELLRAIATLKRLPPPPAILLGGKPEIRVRVEWAFDPGILR